MKKKAQYYLRHYPLTLVCLVLIWYLSVFFGGVETPLDDVAFIDKWTHLVMYGGFTCVIWWEYQRCHDHPDRCRLLCWGWLAPIVMSGCLELIQEYLTTNRCGEWLDLAANATGATLGAAVGWALKKVMRP